MTFDAIESERIYRKAGERAFQLTSEMQTCPRSKNKQKQITVKAGLAQAGAHKSRKECGIFTANVFPDEKQKAHL